MMDDGWVVSKNCLEQKENLFTRFLAENNLYVCGKMVINYQVLITNKLNV